MYAIAGYIRLYGLNPKLKCKHYFILFVFFVAMTYLISIVYTLLGARFATLVTNIKNIYKQEQLPILLISVSLFMTFVNLKMNYHKWINVIATATFGVYLIHDNDLIRPLLWSKNVMYQNSRLFIPYSILAVAIVYIVCTLIDLIRQYTFEKVYNKFVNRYSDYLIIPFKKIGYFFRNVIFGK